MFWHKGQNPITVSATKINQLNFCPQFAIYRNITTLSLSYAHEHCRNPKKLSKKVATLEKTTGTVLYRSTSLLVYGLHRQEKQGNGRNSAKDLTQKKKCIQKA